MSEQRRAGRVNTCLRTQLLGIDDDWTVRRVNLSVTGIYIPIDREVGEPGCVQGLRLQSLDGVHHVELLSRAIRTVITNDIWRGASMAAVAFDFMLPSSGGRDALEALMRCLFEGDAAAVPQGLHGGATPAVQFTYDASVADGQGMRAALVRALNVNSMTLETSAPAAVGDTLRCLVRAPSRKKSFTLQGQVTDSVYEAAPGGASSYRITVRLGSDADVSEVVDLTGAANLPTSHAVELLVREAALHPAETGFTIPNEHLRGMVERVQLPRLLEFLAAERLTGTLELLHEELKATLWLRGGAVIDCTHAPEQAKFTALAEHLTWQRGVFEFTVKPVAGDDAIQMSTSRLLAELAHGSG